MNKKLHGILEIVLASVLVIVGFIVTLKIEILQDYIMWVMIVFFLIKVGLVVIKYFAYESSLLYTIIHGSLHGIIIILMIIFNADPSKMAYVVGASCVADVVANIAKAIIYRKSNRTESFFGMENIICVLFIFLMFSGQESDIATNVILGCLVLYKGLANLVSNMYVKKVISITDLGKALNRVHGLDIFFGLFIILLLTSFILPHVEDSIKDAGDAWWYCFALITTTGFGDLTVTTTTGRILSVIIGFYGIIIVSLLTSSIVIYISDINKREEREKRSEEEAKKLESYTFSSEYSKKTTAGKPAEKQVEQMNLFAAANAKTLKAPKKPKEVKEEPAKEPTKENKESKPKRTVKKEAN